MAPQEYLDQGRQSITAFALLAGLTTSAVHRHLNGSLPGPEAMRLWYLATAGAVRPDDWYDLAAWRQQLAAGGHAPPGP